MPHDRDELEQMKRDIDLRVYAAEHGYQFDRKESWRGSSVMRNPATGDKIIVKLDADGHFVFFSVHSGASGSIIDFAQAQLGGSIGAVRKELRPWINRPVASPLPFAPLPKTSRDRIRVEADYSRTEAVAASLSRRRARHSASSDRVGTFHKPHSNG